MSFTQKSSFCSVSRSLCKSGKRASCMSSDVFEVKIKTESRQIFFTHERDDVELGRVRRRRRVCSEHPRALQFQVSSMKKTLHFSLLPSLSLSLSHTHPLSLSTSLSHITRTHSILTLTYTLSFSDTLTLLFSLAIIPSPCCKSNRLLYAFVRA